MLKKRHVFYLAGFDPRGPSYYHRLYKEQAQCHSDTFGDGFFEDSADGSAEENAGEGVGTSVENIAQGAVENISVGNRQRISKHRHDWSVRCAGTDTNYSYLAWDDIVRRHWARKWLAIFADFFYVLKTYIINGHCWRFRRVSMQRLLTGFYPPVYIASLLLCALSLSVFLARRVYNLALDGMSFDGLELNSMASSADGLGEANPVVLASALAALTVVGLCWALLKGAKSLGDKLAVFWMLRIYVFMARWARGEIDTLESRMESFAQEVLAAIDDDTNDEILIVAHSVGTVLAIPMLAQVIRAMGDDPRLHNRRVALLTLGGCTPLMSLQPCAESFRADLSLLVSAPRLRWLDYTAPSDGACFVLVDPVAICGLSAASDAAPALCSPRFFALYSASYYRELKYDWYNTHFLYLMATQFRGPYNFFTLTAGNQSIAQRRDCAV